MKNVRNTFGSFFEGIAVVNKHFLEDIFAIF